VSQDFSTDRRKVEGLGSSHKGTGVWVKERVSSILLLPVTVWALWTVTRVEGFGYDQLVRWLRLATLNPVLLSLLVVLSVYHMHLGMRVVIEDYIHRPASKGALLLLNLAVCLLVAVAAVISILKVAFAGDIGVSI
jgi:succinate dehydrogenase / fumarate reductase, membrane anchor subunit